MTTRVHQLYQQSKCPTQSEVVEAYAHCAPTMTWEQRQHVAAWAVLANHEHVWQVCTTTPQILSQTQKAELLCFVCQHASNAAQKNWHVLRAEDKQDKQESENTSNNVWPNLHSQWSANGPKVHRQAIGAWFRVPYPDKHRPTEDALLACLHAPNPEQKYDLKIILENHAEVLDWLRDPFVRNLLIAPQDNGWSLLDELLIDARRRDHAAMLDKVLAVVVAVWAHTPEAVRNIPHPHGGNIHSMWAVLCQGLPITAATNYAAQLLLANTDVDSIQIPTSKGAVSAVEYALLCVLETQDLIVAGRRICPIISSEKLCVAVPSVEVLPAPVAPTLSQSIQSVLQLLQNNTPLSDEQMNQLRQHLDNVQTSQKQEEGQGPSSPQTQQRTASDVPSPESCADALFLSPWESQNTDNNEDAEENEDENENTEDETDGEDVLDLEPIAFLPPEADAAQAGSAQGDTKTVAWTPNCTASKKNWSALVLRATQWKDNHWPCNPTNHQWFAFSHPLLDVVEKYIRDIEGNQKAIAALAQLSCINWSTCPTKKSLNDLFHGVWQHKKEEVYCLVFPLALWATNTKNTDDCFTAEQRLAFLHEHKGLAVQQLRVALGTGVEWEEDAGPVGAYVACLSQQPPVTVAIEILQRHLKFISQTIDGKEELFSHASTLLSGCMRHLSSTPTAPLPDNMKEKLLAWCGTYWGESEESVRTQTQMTLPLYTKEAQKKCVDWLANHKDEVFTEWGKKINTKNNQTRMRRVALASSAHNGIQELRASFPHFHEVVDMIEQHLILAQRGNKMFSLPPLLMDGPPGTGKTYFFNELARLSTTDFHIINMEAIQGGMAIVGTDAGWSNAAPGFVFDKMMNPTATINPIILLDELDKNGSSDHYPVVPTLLSLLEPHSAKKFQDRCIQLTMDISHVAWVATSNVLNNVPLPVRSRFEVVKVPNPDYHARVAMARLIDVSLRRDHSWGTSFAPIPQETLEVLCRPQNAARDLRKNLMRGFAAAARAHAPCVRPEDLPLPHQSPRMFWDLPVPENCPVQGAA